MQKWTGRLLVLLFASILCTGCSRVELSAPPHFTLLSMHPSSITITKYNSVNPKDKTTYTLQPGKRMDTLYAALQHDGENALPHDAVLNCPTYSNDTVIWDYHVIVHYAGHGNRSFTQTSNGCTFVKDDRTGALAVGALLGLEPFGQDTTPP